MGRSAVGYVSRRGERSKMKPIVAPIGGLNARDGLAAMPERDAYLLDNIFPETDGVVTRNGSSMHVSGLGAAVETLIQYAGGSSGNLIAVAGNTMYDVTIAGAPSVIHAGFTSARVQATMFSNAGAQFLIGVNGADAPFSFNGVAYAALVITGVTGGQANLIYPFTFKHRLYFAANNVLGFYYLGVDAIQGPAGFFDLAQVAEAGGHLVAIASITRDSGDGPDDNIVFITSRGELIVYEGYDPTDINNWALVGRFKTAPPIGRRCAFKYGGDVVLITELGLIPLTRIMDGGEFDPSVDSISAKLGSSLKAQVAFKDTFGWQLSLHGSNNMLILNVPAQGDGSRYFQYVMNTITKAWCRFTGLNGICWGDYQSDIYYGDSTGNVFKADTGASDNGASIPCDAKQAYHYFDEPREKHWHSAKVLIAYTAAPPLTAALSVDYAEDRPAFAAAPTPDSGAFWDTSDWDTSDWAADLETKEYWIDLNKVGFSASLWLRLFINGQSLRWYATEYLYELGGVI